jgi:hypothetical protein
MVTANVFSYSILDYEKHLYLTIDDMRASNDPQLRSLIRLDVFASSGPRSPRYTKLPIDRCGNVIGRNAPCSCIVSKSDIIKNTSATTSYDSQITEYTSGTLGFLGLGYEDKTVKQIFSNGIATTSTTTEEKITDIQIVNKTSAVQEFEFYYDNHFGTIAVLMVPRYKVKGRQNTQ